MCKSAQATGILPGRGADEDALGGEVGGSLRQFFAVEGHVRKCKHRKRTFNRAGKCFPKERATRSLQFFGAYWLNRKNSCVPEIGFVTVFCPLTTTGPWETGVQLVGEAKLVLLCKVIPPVFVGQDRTALGPEAVIVSCGSNGNLKIVPVPAMPP